MSQPPPGELPGLTRARRALEAAGTPGERLQALDALARETARAADALRPFVSERPAAELLRGLHAGREAAFARLLERLSRLAGTELPVLVEGETGVGKSLLTLAIHQSSAQRAGPFLPLDARQAPPLEDLHQQWQAARGGALVLRHVDALNASAQAALAGWLGDSPTPRLLATSRRDLGAACQAGTFSRPLWHRLQPLRVRLPPLRDTPAAVEALFLQVWRETDSPPPPPEPSALAALRAHRWPGNLRELRTLAEELRGRADAQPLRRSDVVAALREPAPTTRPSTGLPPAGTLADQERALIAARLEALAWHQQQTADSLGIDRKTLYRKIRRYGLKPPAEA